MRLPNPDHPITMTPNPNRVRVTFAGRLVADTTRALTLKEASLPAVQYIPREGVDMALLHRTEQPHIAPTRVRPAILRFRSATARRKMRGASSRFRRSPVG
jgi:uncharacterized protein (DUF427 family)